MMWFNLQLPMPICEVWLTTETCANSEMLLIISTVKAAEQWQWALCYHFEQFCLDPLNTWLTGKIAPLSGKKTHEAYHIGELFFSQNTFTRVELMCLVCAVWDNGIFLLGILEECSGKSSAQQTKACCLVMLCIMLAWTFSGSQRWFPDARPEIFFTTPKMGEGGIHLSASQWLH